MVADFYHDLFREKPQKTATRNLGKPLAALVFLIISIVSILLYKRATFASSFVSPIPLHVTIAMRPTTSVIAKKSQKKASPKEQEELLKKIKVLLESSVGTYSIYVYDLTTNETFGLNEYTTFDAASVNKIPILFALYNLSEKGSINLDKTVTIQEGDIQDYGSGQLRYENPGKIYSVKSLARLMMEKSDNTAAYILANQIIGYGILVKQIQTLDLAQTDINKNLTTNYDMAMLMIKLYRREIISEPLVREMFDFMKDTDFEDRLPKLLPKDVAVYHKTGDQVSVSHDIGIVDLPKNPYYIGIMTSNMLLSEAEVKETQATISKLVYDYEIKMADQ